MAGALVEIWQANKYVAGMIAEGAANPRPLDPNFQYWAEMLSDAEGRFRFKTIKPGAYPAGDTVGCAHRTSTSESRRGYHELVTQMYFAGEELNEKDLIRKELSPKERDSVTIALQPAAEARDTGAQMAQFDITLRSVG